MNFSNPRNLICFGLVALALIAFVFLPYLDVNVGYASLDMTAFEVLSENFEHLDDIEDMSFTCICLIVVALCVVGTALCLLKSNKLARVCAGVGALATIVPMLELMDNLKADLGDIIDVVGLGFWALIVCFAGIAVLFQPE